MKLGTLPALAFGLSLTLLANGTPKTLATDAADEPSALSGDRFTTAPRQ